MTDIYLHGAAAERFGPHFRLDVRDATEAVRALGAQIKDFIPFVRGASWRIIRGSLAKNQELELATMHLAIGRAGELHLIPVPAGSISGKAVGKIVAGVAIVALSVVTAGAAAPAGAGLAASMGASTGFLGITYAQIGLFGASLIFVGASSLLATTPSQPKANDREKSPASALFNGPVNLVEPGNAIPLAYGKKVRVGSIVVSAGIFTDQLLNEP